LPIGYVFLSYIDSGTASSLSIVAIIAFIFHTFSSAVKWMFTLTFA
jgi:hypothetical protein